MRTINVTNSGEKVEKVKIAFDVDVPMPGGKPRAVGAGKYNFNEMEVGNSFTCKDMDEVKAATQAFKSDVYKPAQEKGKLSYRDMSRHGGEGFRVWLIANTPKGDSVTA